MDGGIAVGGGITIAGGAIAAKGFVDGRGVVRKLSNLASPAALNSLAEVGARMPEPLTSSGGIIKLLDPRRTVEAIRYGTETAHAASIASKAVQADTALAVSLKSPALRSGALLAGGALLAAVGVGVLIASAMDS